MSKAPKQHFESLLKEFDEALLVTRSNDGKLRCRPMAIADREQTAELWFVTSLDSAKINEVRADPEVCVAMQKGQKFLSLSGKASVVRDRGKTDELWREPWKDWFPGGRDDPSLALLRVEPSEGEYWDNDNSGAQGLRYLFEAGKARLTGSRPDADPDVHQKVDL